ncbi:transcription termination/antitermination protein NusG [Actinomycetaceae bacterium TAE3-ERU4]|nr:transcription termination/antitermination protein NusG [Actinomycetaceae bacterium TAE3-ERU4]
MSNEFANESEGLTAPVTDEPGVLDQVAEDSLEENLAEELLASAGQDEVEADVAAQPAADDSEPTPDEDADSRPVDVQEVIRRRLNEFRNELRTKPGDWYIVHSYSGHERKVKANLEQRASSLGMEDYIHEVLVPMEEIIEMKNATRKRVTRVRMPGYVMVRMSLDSDNAVLRTVKDTPAVTGFVGDSRLKDRENQIPTPLSLPEAYAMLAPQVEQEVIAELEAAAVATPAKAIKVEYEAGETVSVINGPFAGQSATVSEVMPEAKKVVVTLTLFGRDTSTELSMEDIRKED